MNPVIRLQLYTTPLSLKAKKTEKNNNESFDKLHMILLIHVYALAQKGQVK